MSGPRGGACYADRVWQGTVEVIENERVARDTYRLRFRCEAIARRILPGQFLMLRLPGCSDPLLGRAFALYRAAGEAVEIVYLVVGKMTSQLRAYTKGQRLEAWGSLGNGFPATPTEHLLMVAGGIGQTPFFALAQECLGLSRYGDPPRQAARAKKVTLLYGARNKEYLACVADFQEAGVEVRLATDDGSEGHHGMVTKLIGPAVEQSAMACRVVCCGPEAMMAAAAKIARRLGIPCQVSLESPMACGIGACFSCVAKIRDAAGQWDYRRTCVEGPVFDAEDVVFD